MDNHKRSLRNLSPDELAGLLSQAGLGDIAPEEISSALEQGAPVNPDGTVHLVQFGAWLNQQLAERN